MKTMEIETDRISIRELNEQDIPFLAEIARDIAVKDSTELLNKAQENSELCQFIQLYSPQLLKVPPQDSQIKDENLHCNFSMISPPFQDNAQKFFENAVNRKNESPRQSFWMAIKLKDSNAPIDGIIMMTTKGEIDPKNNKKIIGQSGVFLSPKFQKKGYVAEAKAVLFDLTYKKLLPSLNIAPDDTVYQTECHPLNTASQRLQQSFGGKLQQNNISNFSHPRLRYQANKEDIYNSKSMLKQINRNLHWSAIMDNGEKISSTVGLQNPLKNNNKNQNLCKILKLSGRPKLKRSINKTNQNNNLNHPAKRKNKGKLNKLLNQLRFQVPSQVTNIKKAISAINSVLISKGKER